jgi:hypothetical protein
MPTYFVIEALEDGYQWQDFTLNDMALEYAVDVLQIPAERIESIEFVICPNRLELTISEERNMIAEDWYYTLVPFAA